MSLLRDPYTHIGSLFRLEPSGIPGVLNMIEVPRAESVNFSRRGPAWDFAHKDWGYDFPEWMPA